MAALQRGAEPVPVIAAVCTPDRLITRQRGRDNADNLKFPGYVHSVFNTLQRWKGPRRKEKKKSSTYIYMHNIFYPLLCRYFQEF